MNPLADADERGGIGGATPPNDGLMHCVFIELGDDEYNSSKVAVKGMLVPVDGEEDVGGLPRNSLMLFLGGGRI